MRGRRVQLNPRSPQKSRCLPQLLAHSRIAALDKSGSYRRFIAVAGPAILRRRLKESGGSSA